MIIIPLALPYCRNIELVSIPWCHSLVTRSLTHPFTLSTHSSLPILILLSGGSFVVAGSFDGCVTAAVSLPRPTAIRAACSNLVLYQSRSLGCVPVRPSLQSPGHHPASC